MAFETALEQWQAGLRRLEAAPLDERPVLEQVTREVHAELRRRLGSAFTTDELVALYDAGTGWVAGVAVAAAPDAPFAWDVRIVGDAAFARYLREAVDYAAAPATAAGPARAREPVDDPGAAEAEPRVEVLGRAVGVGEQEREPRRSPPPPRARRPRRRARARGAPGVV